MAVKKEPTPAELRAKRLGVNACARVMGCSPANIIKHEGKGLFVRGADKKFAMKEVKAAFEAMNPLSRATGKYGGANGNPGSKKIEEVDEGSDKPAGLIGSQSIADIKKSSEFWKSELARTKYQREIGELVELKVVTQTLFSIGKKMQSKMMAWTTSSAIGHSSRTPHTIGHRGH